MFDHRDHLHPPEPPVITVSDLQQLLGQLPPEWHVSVEDTVQLLLFDGTMQPRGNLNVATGNFRLVEVTPDGAT